MRELLVSTLLLTSFLCIPASAQSTGPDIARLQNTFKKQVIKHSGVTSIKYRGCEVTARVVFQRPFRGSGGRGGWVGGGFPNDEASNTLSAGPDPGMIGRLRAVDYTFDLSTVDTGMTEVVPGIRENTSIIRLVPASSVRISGDFPAPPPFFAVSVKEKIAPEILSSFKQLVAACSSQTGT